MFEKEEEETSDPKKETDIQQTTNVVNWKVSLAHV